MTATLSALGQLVTAGYGRDALLAGTGIAVAAGLVGYLVVLRGQVFAGDALSHVAFTGALGALAFGVDLRAGLYGGCVAFALLAAFLGGRARSDDTAVGSVLAWVLGLGALFLSLYTTRYSGGAGGAGNAGVTVLFGSIFGLSTPGAVLDATLGLLAAVVVVVIARPLLFATLDEAVASARGVPTRALGVVFLVVLGVTAGDATQAVGALLLLGLLAAPAGAALHLTSRPYAGLAVAAVTAVVSLWVGLAVAVVVPSIPPSFAILAAATLAYVGAAGWSHRPGRKSSGAGAEPRRSAAPAGRG